jgi:hypothetical protein
LRSGLSMGCTAPPHKFETLARPNATFSRFCIQLPVFHPPTMAPRTILGTIDGNRGVRKELTPNQRGKIEGARLAGTTFKVASEIGECALSTAKITIRRAPERHDGISKPRSGRPKEWDARFERRVVRIVRMHPRITYAQMRD